MSSPIAVRVAVLACLAVLIECGSVERSLRQVSSGHEVEVSSDLDKDTADAITDFLAEDANTSAGTEPQAATSKVAVPTTTSGPRPSTESTTSSHPSEQSTTSTHKVITSAASAARSTTSLRRTTTSAAPASTTSAAPASTTSAAPASTTSVAPTSTTSRHVSPAPAFSTAETLKLKKAPVIVRSLLATTPGPANGTEAKQSTTTLAENLIAGLPMADLVDEEVTTTTSTTSGNQSAVSLSTTVFPSMADAIKASLPSQKQNSSHADMESPSVATMRAEIKAELEKEYATKFKAELNAQLVKALAKDQGPVSSTSAISSPSTTHILTTTTTTRKTSVTTTMTWDELYKWESAHEPSTTTTTRLHKAAEAHEAQHARHSEEHQHHVWQRHNYHHRAGLVAKGTLAANANTKPQGVAEHPGIFHRLLQQFSKVEHRVMDLGHILLAKMGFAHSSSAKSVGGHEVAAMVQTSESAVEHQNPVQTAMLTDEQRLDTVSAGDAWASSQDQDGKLEFQASHDPALKNAL